MKHMDLFNKILLVVTAFSSPLSMCHEVFFSFYAYICWTKSPENDDS
jgi:hypothetical protein